MQGHEHTNSNTRPTRRSRQERDRHCLALYALTVVLEAPAMLARYFATKVAMGVLLGVTGSAGDPGGCGLVVSVVPILWSAFALVDPGGGGDWWRVRLGGRRPSQRELKALANALGAIEARTNAPLPHLAAWFVLDDPRCEAAVYGNTMMMSSGALALAEDHLPALFAHELGHLRGIDAKLTVALNRLVLKSVQLRARPPGDARDGNDPHGSGSHREAGPRLTAREVMLLDRRARGTLAAMGLTRWTLSKVVALMRGGIGLHLTAPAWAALLREQEYDADEWAADIGWGRELADFLETHVLELDHPIPLVAMSSHPHPPTELRIDRLRAVPPFSLVHEGTGEPVWIDAHDGV